MREQRKATFIPQRLLLSRRTARVARRWPSIYTKMAALSVGRLCPV